MAPARSVQGGFCLVQVFLAPSRSFDGRGRMVVLSRIAVEMRTSFSTARGGRGSLLIPERDNNKSEDDDSGDGWWKRFQTKVNKRKTSAALVAFRPDCRRNYCRNTPPTSRTDGERKRMGADVSHDGNMILTGIHSPQWKLRLANENERRLLLRGFNRKGKSHQRRLSPPVRVIHLPLSPSPLPNRAYPQDRPLWDIQGFDCSFLGCGQRLDPASAAVGRLILKGRVDHALDLGQIVRGSVVSEVMLLHRCEVCFGLSVADDVAKLLGDFVQLSQLTTEGTLLWCFDEAFLSRAAPMLARSRWRREHPLYGALPVKGLVGLLRVRWLALWDRRRLERWPGRVARRLAGRSGARYAWATRRRKKPELDTTEDPEEKLRFSIGDAPAICSALFNWTLLVESRTLGAEIWERLTGLPPRCVAARPMYIGEVMCISGFCWRLVRGMLEIK
ncbi:hypothetical protein KC323_g205 [Hortaea werneckii]|nr:hypothetical protein KC323_g205 [Hortaea werneckii]